VAAFTDQHISAVEWQQILVTGLGAFGVFVGADETGPAVPAPTMPADSAVAYDGPANTAGSAGYGGVDEETDLGGRNRL
jgi:hypothetical protein